MPLACAVGMWLRWSSEKRRMEQKVHEIFGLDQSAGSTDHTSASAAQPTGGKMSMGVMVPQRRQTHLFQLILALHATCCLARRLYGRDRARAHNWVSQAG